MSKRSVLTAALCCLSLWSCQSKSSVIRSRSEAAGANCANGGIAVQFGVDADGNGVLDDGEVDATQTKYLCNGATGATGPTGATGAMGDAGVNALTRVTAEPVGTNCAYGGSRVDVGLDRDGDGVLSSAEITTTSYVCDRATLDTVHFGDVTIRTAADVAALDGIETLVGNLVVTSAPTPTVTFTTLKNVVGPFQNDQRSGLTALAFPELISISKIDVSGDDLTTFTAPKLAKVSDLQFVDVPKLAGIDLPSLSNANVYVDSAVPVTSLSFPALVTGGLRASYHEKITSVSLPRATNLDTLGLQNMPLLATLSVPVLAKAGEIFVDSDPLLTTNPFTALTSVSFLSWTDSPMTTFSMPGLINGGLNLSGNQKLTSISLPAMVTSEQLYLQSIPLITTISLPALTRVVRELYVTNNPQLTAFSAPLLQSVRNLGFQSNPLTTTLSLPALTTATGNMQVLYQPALTSLTFPVLQSMNSLNLYGLPELTTVALPQLTTSTGDFRVNGLPKLTSLTMPMVTSLNDFNVSYNPMLTTLSLPALTKSTQSFVVNGNGLLATLNLPLLTSAFAFQVVGNPNLAECPVLRLGTSVASGSVDVSSNNTTVPCVPADYCKQLTMTGFTDGIYRCVRSQNFTTANTSCSSLSMAGTGKLLWLTSDAEWASLKALASRLGGGWFGLTDSAAEGMWASVNSAVTYSPTSRTDFWASGEPNGNTNENCAQLLGYGLVNDLSCNAGQPFYCRVP